MATKYFASVLVAGLFIVAASPTAVAQSQVLTEPFVVPLQLLSGGNRLGISALIAGGTFAPPVTYVFDTGSPMFVSAYGTTGTTGTQTAAWWGPQGSFTLTGSSGTIPFTGGGGYAYDLVNVAVTLSSTAGASLTTGSSYSVAQCTQHFYNGKPQTEWLAQSPPSGTVPPLQYTFYGTFGADLTDPTNGLYGFVNQFQTGTGITTGFVVDATSASPTLTLGLDQSVKSRFSNVVPMVAGTNGGFMKNIVNSNFSFTGTTVASSTTFSAVPTLFDTGTPGSMVIYTGSAMPLPSEFQSLQDFTVQFSLGDVTWSVSSPDITVTSATDGVGGITLGLPFFQNYAVMYDVGNGNIGFAAAAVPEPSTLLLAASGLGAALLARRRRGAAAGIAGLARDTCAVTHGATSSISIRRYRAPSLRDARARWTSGSIA